MTAQYNEDTIRSLNWKEHIRLRPGMYIGRLGDGASHDDGIYVLIKEIIDNSIDEYTMGFGRHIDVTLKDKCITIRDFGRGMPLGKVAECVSQINTGAKYDNKVFKKAVGLNGVGSKAVNALSSYFKAQSFRDGVTRIVEFNAGEICFDNNSEDSTTEANGTLISFIPDVDIFGEYAFVIDYIDNMFWNFAFLNTGLTLYFNGNKYHAKEGLKNLLEKVVDNNPMVYPIIHFREDDLEVAITHVQNQYGEKYYSFVNGQHTSQGGTHQAAFRESIVKTIRDFYKKDFDHQDIHASICATISIKVQEPLFESQTKTKLGSNNIEPNGQSIRNYVSDILSRKLDDYLHKHSETAELLLDRIKLSERERKDMAGIKKLARESIKKASLHNKKLRDCKIHYNSNNERKENSTIFITEGDSASGSITKTRDVSTQAVFSLKGKPLNCFGKPKRIVYQNEEFNLLQAALNIEEGIENLRYNNIIIATDADVDGMHIRLLLLTFFLQFYPDVVESGHLYILQTPLFRVRNKKETYYCYSDQERKNAIKKLGGKPEITRFKGLGEISPNEFKQLIGAKMRLEPVIYHGGLNLHEMLQYYMGANSSDRQDFIIDNLRVEEKIVELQ